MARDSSFRHDPADGAADPATVFPLRTSRWARPLIFPFAPRRPMARIVAGVVEVEMGVLGRARVPVARVARVSTMRWPWWGGVGVRIGRGLVAFVAAGGDAAVIETDEPMTVRAPFGWRTHRVVVGVEDVEGFVEAVARARRAL